MAFLIFVDLFFHEIFHLNGLVLLLQENKDTYDTQNGSKDEPDHLSVGDLSELIQNYASSQ